VAKSLQSELFGCLVVWCSAIGIRKVGMMI
jgi:hypothetical protein